MKKNTEIISKAYFEEQGNRLGKNVEGRIHWILENSTGERIIDVGCSQGNIPILLGREGKDVIGIDILADAIDYANKNLTEEEESTKRHVTFVNDNFMDYQFESYFDVVIMGEILNHISDPERFIKKAYTLLKDGGRLIVTVPFGIHNNLNHEKTFYINDLLAFSNYGFNPIETEYKGKWIGAVFEKQQDGVNPITQLGIGEIGKLEKAFLKLETDYINELHKQKEQLNSNLENSYQEHMKEKDSEIEDLHDKISDLEQQVELEKNQSLQIKKELFEQLEKEKLALQELVKANTRYESLKKSKLGQLTVKYWKWKKSRR